MLIQLANGSVLQLASGAAIEVSIVTTESTGRSIIGGFISAFIGSFIR